MSQMSQQSSTAKRPYTKKLQAYWTDKRRRAWMNQKGVDPLAEFGQALIKAGPGDNAGEFHILHSFEKSSKRRPTELACWTQPSAATADVSQTLRGKSTFIANISSSLTRMLGRSSSGPAEEDGSGAGSSGISGSGFSSENATEQLPKAIPEDVRVNSAQKTLSAFDEQTEKAIS